MKTEFILQAAQAVNDAIKAHEAEIESLDREIGDGDHYVNLCRGIGVVLAMREELAPLAPDEALKRIGMKLLSTIGGASGPLIASFFISMAQSVKEQGGDSLTQIATAFAAGGTRFMIRNAVVWNLIDQDGRYCGQAARFDPPLPSDILENV